MIKKIVCVIALVLTCVGIQAESLPFGKGVLHVEAITPNAFRVKYIEKSHYDLLELLYVKDSSFKLKRSETNDVTTFTTSEGYSLCIDSKQLVLTVKDKDGRTVFFADKIEMEPSEIAEMKTNIATLRFDSPADECLYGLGQFQDGYTNIRGLSRRLTQVNTQISIPFLLSSRGYGLLWNNYGMTEYNPLPHSVTLEKTTDEGSEELVNVTTTQGSFTEKRSNNYFKTEINVEEDGNYSLLLDVGQKMARRHSLIVDGKPLIDVQNIWLPPTTSTLTHLTKGKHVITAELEADDKPVLYYGKTTDSTVLSSPVAGEMDFTIFVGNADEVMTAYHDVTGHASLLPKWAYGYIHCRERYHSQEELLQAARKFRELHIPIDLIVQDWQWWGKYGWNAMQFDEDNYPDPKAMTDELHNMDMRLMVSVWSNISRNCEVGKYMNDHGFYIPETDWTDFFNQKAADGYWKQFSSRLLPLGIDAWWQDATEPENDDLAGRRVCAGKYPGEVFRNCYSLLVNKTVFEGCRKDRPNERTMTLTRCGFAGIQRYGAAMWSGDVGNDFPTLRRQIQAGLGMQAAGIPWWTYDAGGFFRPSNQYTDSDYIERLLRWTEVAVYLPLMRIHGYQSNTEPWNYGPEAQRILTDCIRERYRLMPYIYSNAASVTRNGGTIMRPLVFDFPDDPEALAQDCEYMFGRAMLINPVTEKGVTTYPTYLPRTKGGWYYQGSHFDGGKTVTTPVDLATIPVFYRAGSIIPVGKVVESTRQRQDNLTINVYPGNDGQFDLYDDEGENYNFEKGNCSIIHFDWDDTTRTLTIAKCKGSYPGMAKTRHFEIEVVGYGKVLVTYKGKKTVLKVGEDFYSEYTLAR